MTKAKWQTRAEWLYHTQYGHKPDSEALTRLDSLISRDSTFKAELPPYETEWRKDLPPELQPIALRHGQTLFEIAFHCVTAQAALQHMSTRIKAQDAQLRLQALAYALTRLGQIALAGTGAEMSAYLECVGDIQRAWQIRGAQEEAGRIILPH